MAFKMGQNIKKATNARSCMSSLGLGENIFRGTLSVTAGLAKKLKKFSLIGVPAA